jgi:alkanesulfonate monooxygenase SsuD/methylene tetrahydromethanopterin reductase-like flavin-dependent oxidoreductase (luciferase family)
MCIAQPDASHSPAQESKPAMFHHRDLFHTSLGFDLRAPEQFGVTSLQIFNEALAMIEYADKNGIEKVDFQEHHQSEDGYVPCPILPGVAAAARTKNIAIVIGAIILPFHDPVKVAEQVAVADLLSNGRFYAVLAAGYSPTEFAAFGVRLEDRARIMDEGFDTILRALAGERFQFKGREVFVRPLPSRPPHEIVFAGGGTRASARRAARFGLSMWPMNSRIIPDYEAACAEFGVTGTKFIRGITSVYVTDDPEQGWADLEPHLLHYARSYAKWSASPETSASPLHGLDSIEKIRAAGLMQVLTPDEAVELGKTRAIGQQPLIGGLHPDKGWKSLELFVNKVLPQIKDAPAQWRKTQGL